MYLVTIPVVITDDGGMGQDTHSAIKLRVRVDDGKSELDALDRLSQRLMDALAIPGREGFVEPTSEPLTDEGDQKL